MYRWHPPSPHSPHATESMRAKVLAQGGAMVEGQAGSGRVERCAFSVGIGRPARAESKPLLLTSSCGEFHVTRSCGEERKKARKRQFLPGAIVFVGVKDLVWRPNLLCGLWGLRGK